MGFRNSYVGNLSLFYEIEEKLKQGHNVVLISNHHTEADPIIISLLLEKANPHIAENMLPGWYIAWLLLKMEHYFLGFPQILILDANRIRSLDSRSSSSGAVSMVLIIVSSSWTQKKNRMQSMLYIWTPNF
ncbi:uncharacterized protein [Gossypium hirsutum]|uniref:Uncharacterized protein isoform X1 n=1 Tax=Gossypium hirsutum TaxID=3635 RepID=A0ABM3AZH7_GOSHI|nr:uncharacterized protein LOC107922531 isoform X1 [Gossypium hirsutum]XP_040960211.1 uncharacterized protein LOC107922531 isoform X1 [Gossypium hirsutum]XP_040960212.1 uncharacterized protein LOC107922531 isoform X1 [Gossypium hirsutum]XP_040960213.1 uncharacterized protein LOC107922531 isoform X1 [Gossypium hirsutum]XP_040960214.1 uncharacterized protein LOC107922531 isoform X1 [Gossypium hirsutum]